MVMTMTRSTMRLGSSSLTSCAMSWIVSERDNRDATALSDSRQNLSEA